MPISERPADRGARRGRLLNARVVQGLIDARMAGGLSQREIGRRLRCSHSLIQRIEAGRTGLSIELAARWAAIVGLELAASLHPDGDPVRDKAHLSLLERLRSRLPPTLRWRTEVPMPIEGDRRAADALIGGSDFTAMVEAETRLGDVQGLDRRIAGKQRDLGVERVILLLADTRHNRRVVSETPALTTRFPVTTRACLAALASGRPPAGDALVIL